MKNKENPNSFLKIVNAQHHLDVKLTLHIKKKKKKRKEKNVHSACVEAS